LRAKWIEGAAKAKCILLKERAENLPLLLQHDKEV